MLLLQVYCYLLLVVVKIVKMVILGMWDYEDNIDHRDLLNGTNMKNLIG